MVSLVAAYSESMLKDFAALRTSAVHQWFALQSELLQNPPGGVAAAGTGTSASSEDIANILQGHLVAAQQVQQQVQSHAQSTVPTSTLPELLQQNEVMLIKLVNREKSSLAKLSRLLDEELMQRAASETKVVELQARIVQLDGQVAAAQSNKFSSEQRYSTEVSTLQQRIAQLAAELDKSQDEYSEMISSLTKSQEEQISRQAGHLASVMEQRISEATVRISIFVLCIHFHSQQYISF